MIKYENSINKKIKYLNIQLDLNLQFPYYWIMKQKEYLTIGLRVKNLVKEFKYLF